MVDGSLMVLYTKDRFDWSQHQLMQYNTYYNALIVFGQFFCFPFLENYVKMLTIKRYDFKIGKTTYGAKQFYT